MKKAFISLAIVVTGLSLAIAAQAQNALQGAWELEEVTTVGGEDPGTSTDLPPSLYVFTDGYYANMWIPGDGSRPNVGLNAGDEGIIAAYNSFFAQSGSYEVYGSTIRFQIWLSKVPAAMGKAVQAEYRVEGDTLYLTQTNALNVRIHSKLVRLE